MAEQTPTTADLQEVSQVPGSCAHFNLRRADRVMTQLYDQMLRPSGVKPTQFTLLAAIRLKGPVTIKGLADAIAMDRTTLTRNLRPLLKEGWVEIAPGTDRRVREVSLTAEGSSALERALPLWRKAQDHVAERFGSERMGRMIAELAAVAHVIQE